MAEKLNHRNAALRVCIDTADAGGAAGRVYSRRLTEPILFSDLGGCLLQIDHLLEAQNFPQAFQRVRSFAGRGLEEPEGVLPDGAMPAEVVAAAQGEKMTFLLLILTRRNATWQGKVDWLDGTERETFSSDLDLLALVEHRLSM